MSVAQQKYFKELAALADKTVSVVTTTGKTFSGTLIGVNPDNMSIAIGEGKDETGKPFDRIFLNGSIVAQITSAEKSFDLKALSKQT